MFDFPNPPLTVGQQITGSNGVVYTWNGVAWTTGSGAGDAFLPFAGGTMSGDIVLPPSANPAAATTVGQAARNVGRNFIHNGLFNIQQRGVGAWTTNGSYTADRWRLEMIGDTSNVSIVALGDSGRTAIGDEAARSVLYVNVNGAATAANYTQIGQAIESLSRLAGKTVTVSFWAATVTNLSVGVRLAQVFGTGGSPSAGFNVPPQTVALSPTPTRHSLTFSLPSIAGMTLGANGDDRTVLYFGLSSGATNSALLGVGVQTGAIWFWGIQLEIGTVATPLEKLDPQVDLANCQRFYQTTTLPYMVAGPGLSGSFAGWVPVNVTFAVVMRAAPTVTMAFGGQGTSGWNLTAYNIRQDGITVWPATQAPSGATAATSFFYNASADL